VIPAIAPTSDIDHSDPATVRDIAARDAGLNGARNVEITRSYFEIGRRLRRRLGQANADWATSAAWASGAVGLIIRREETNTSRVLRIAKILGGELYDRVLLQVRRNLEEGNRQVYSELGLAFAELAWQFGDRDHWTPKDEREFLRSLPATRRSVPVEWQCCTDLAPAFRLYFEALRLRDDIPEERKRKSELVFAANVLATVSEQAGLQPFLNAAFERVARFVGERPIGRIPVVRGGVQVVGYSAQALGQRVVTEFGIKVPVGEHALAVGKSIRPHNGRLWAPDLTELREPPAQKAWRDYSRAGDDGRGSSADDWTVMRDRMNFITNFFRAWQQDPILQIAPQCLA
jgi:hypothetical protein